MNKFEMSNVERLMLRRKIKRKKRIRTLIIIMLSVIIVLCGVFIFVKSRGGSQVGFEKSSCGKAAPAGGKGPVCQEKGEVKAGHVPPVPGSAL